MCSRAPPPSPLPTPTAERPTSTRVLRAGAPNTFSPNSSVTVASGGTLGLNGLNQTRLEPQQCRSGEHGHRHRAGHPLDDHQLHRVWRHDRDEHVSRRRQLSVGPTRYQRRQRDGYVRPAPYPTPAARAPRRWRMASSVVQTINGGSTAPGAFTLAGRGTGWCLRLFFSSGEALGAAVLTIGFCAQPSSSDRYRPSPDPATDPADRSGAGAAAAGCVFRSLGRRSRPTAWFQPIARQLGMTTLGTLHERTGDTSLITNRWCRCARGVQLQCVSIHIVMKATPDTSI